MRNPFFALTDKSLIVKDIFFELSYYADVILGTLAIVAILFWF